MLVVRPRNAPLVVLTAIILSSTKGKGGGGGINGNGRIELREGERGIVKIDPGDRGSFGVVGAPDAAIVAEIHANLTSGELDESNDVVVHVRKTRAARREIRNDGRPTGAAIFGAHNPGKISAGVGGGGPTKKDDVLILGIDLDDVVVPALKPADVWRGGLRPGSAAVGGDKNAEIVA